MSRWLVLTVSSMVLGGCAPSIQGGLANAPRLGGTGLADERVSDVISNGGDACGRYAEQGPLRYQVPACPGAPRQGGVASSTWPVPARRAPGNALVVPWLVHYYVQPSCKPALPSDGALALFSAPASACSRDGTSRSP
ncbi:MAG: hypothetical protein JOZ69_25795 [Myxococcales bacterium]|nr:hypothetical protein [Myxococcales bacterium]